MRKKQKKKKEKCAIEKTLNIVKNIISADSKQSLRKINI